MKMCHINAVIHPGTAGNPTAMPGNSQGTAGSPTGIAAPAGSPTEGVKKNLPEIKATPDATIPLTAQPPTPTNTPPPAHHKNRKSDEKGNTVSQNLKPLIRHAIKK